MSLAGTRIIVSVILDNLAANVSRGVLLRIDSNCTHEDFQAAMEHSAVLAREKIVPLFT